MNAAPSNLTTVASVVGYPVRIIKPSVKKIQMIPKTVPTNAWIKYTNSNTLSLSIFFKPYVIIL